MNRYLLMNGGWQLCLVVWTSSVSVEDRGVGALDDLSLAEQSFPLKDAAGLRYSSLISEEVNRDGNKHTASLHTCMTYLYVRELIFT